MEHTCQQDQQPLNSRDRFLRGLEAAGEPLSLPQAPLISPNNPGHSVVQFDQEGGGNSATCQVALHGGHGGHGGHQKLPSPFRHTQDSGYQGSEYIMQRAGNNQAGQHSRMPSHDEGLAPGDDDDGDEVGGYGEETAALGRRITLRHFIHNICTHHTATAEIAVVTGLTG